VRSIAKAPRTTVSARLDELQETFTRVRSMATCIVPPS
jgi:hypothetical protein